MVVNQRGQSLIEFVMALSFAGIVIGGGGTMALNSWRKVHCARKVFEATHARLVGIPVRSLTGVTLNETAAEVQGEAICGQIREKIAFKKLEPEDPE